MKKSKFNSIDETAHDFIFNRKSEIEGLTTVCTKTIYNYVHSRLIALKPINMPLFHMLFKYSINLFYQYHLNNYFNLRIFLTFLFIKCLPIF